MLPGIKRNFTFFISRGSLLASVNLDKFVSVEFSGIKKRAESRGHRAKKYPRTIDNFIKHE